MREQRDAEGMPLCYATLGHGTAWNLTCNAARALVRRSRHTARRRESWSLWAHLRGADKEAGGQDKDKDTHLKALGAGMMLLTPTYQTISSSRIPTLSIPAVNDGVQMPKASSANISSSQALAYCPYVEETQESDF